MALLDAASRGNLEEVRTSLLQGTDINFKGEHGRTALYLAALKGEVDIAELLLERTDIEVNVIDKNWDTPLHIAALYGHPNLVKLLLERTDIDPNAKNRINETPYETVKEYSWDSEEKKAEKRVTKNLLQQRDEKSMISELRGHIGLETTGDLLEILQLGQYKCFWNRVYIVGPYFSGKSCLAKLLVGDPLPQGRESTDGIWIYMGRAGMNLDKREWIFISKGDAVKEILMSMMMTLSKSESLHTENKQTSLYESIEFSGKQDDAFDVDVTEASTHGLFSAKRNTTSNIVESESEHSKGYSTAINASNAFKVTPARTRITDTPTSEQNLIVSHTSSDSSDFSLPSKTRPTTSSKQHETSAAKPVREKYKENLLKEVENELSRDKLHEMVFKSLREGKYKQNIIPIDVWDFGGQKDYYMTHQLFITSRGIFVLVFNGSIDLHKHLPDLSFLPGHFGKSNIAVYLLHWVNSILTYCKRSEDGFPRIVFVATHKDKIRKNIDKHKQKLMKELQDLFQSHAGLTHLEFNPLVFVNAMDTADPEIQALRQRLMDRATEHPRWGELMPTAWVPLELQLSQQAEKGVNIMLKEQIRKLNTQNETMVLTDKQLETFLKAQHSLGKLLYFDIANLRDFVIITPSYLVEVLRSIVTEKQFWPKGKRFQQILQTMQQTGAISRDNIYFIWNQATFKHILPYKDFIIEILVHLDILVASRTFEDDLSTPLQSVSQFLVPFMITSPNNTKYLNKFCTSKNAILLSYRFIEKVIPPAFQYRFLASFVDMWDVKNYKSKKHMLFSDLAVVEVDSKHDVAVQVIENRVVVSLIHTEKKENILPTLATSVQECLTAAVHRISEFYSTLSAEMNAKEQKAESHMVMPFKIEFGVHCNKTLCFFLHDRIPCHQWRCDTHKKCHDVSCLKLWLADKAARDQCAVSCRGLNRLEMEQSPSDKQIRRLASNIGTESCRQLLVMLGLEVRDWEEVEAQFNSPAFHENDFKFTVMLKWKQRTIDSSFRIIEDAFAAINLDKHLLCEICRDVDVDDILKRFSIQENKTNTVPSNYTLQKLSNHYIGNSGMQLGIELGLDSTVIQGIQYEHKGKLVQQNKVILQVWSQTKFPKPTVKDLIKALHRIGKIGCLKNISF